LCCHVSLLELVLRERHGSAAVGLVVGVVMVELELGG
jgi:hypothetical protein